MRQLANLITWSGDYLMKLSDGARKALVFGLLIGLGGGAIYKLFVSLEALNKPLPAASTEQLIKPMQTLFNQTSAHVSGYQQTRQHDMKRLDSLAKAYSSQKRPNKP